MDVWAADLFLAETVVSTASRPDTLLYAAVIASRGGGGGGGGLVVAVGGGCGEVQSYSSCHVQKKKTGWGILAERKIGISGEAPPPHDPIHDTQPWEEDPVLLLVKNVSPWGLD